MPTPTQHSQPPAAGEAAHTPGPYSVITDDADGNRSAAHYNRRTLVFSRGTETIVASTWRGASNGQPLNEAEANAAFIVTALNSHAPLTAENAALREGLAAALRSMDSLAHACFDSKVPVFDLVDPRKSPPVQHARALLSGQPAPENPLNKENTRMRIALDKLAHCGFQSVEKIAVAALDGQPAPDPVKAQLVEALNYANEMLAGMTGPASVEFRRLRDAALAATKS